MLVLTFSVSHFLPVLTMVATFATYVGDYRYRVILSELTKSYAFFDTDPCHEEAAECIDNFQLDSSFRRYPGEVVHE